MEKKHKPLRVEMDKPEDEDKVMAGLTISPEMSAGLVTHCFTGNLLGDDAAGITELVEALRDSTKRVNAGDLATLEGMLLSQATALQTIFASYTRRAQVQEYQGKLESFMGMALKAQAQSRATIQALVDLKYPRQATFVKQANIANGPQQVVNSGAMLGPKGEVPQHTHAEDFPTEQIKVLEDGRHGSTYLDLGTTPTAARGHSEMETVGAVHRPKKRGRKD